MWSRHQAKSMNLGFINLPNFQWTIVLSFPAIVCEPENSSPCIQSTEPIWDKSMLKSVGDSSIYETRPFTSPSSADTMGLCSGTFSWNLRKSGPAIQIVGEPSSAGLSTLSTWNHCSGWGPVHQWIFWTGLSQRQPRIRILDICKYDYIVNQEVLRML